MTSFGRPTIGPRVYLSSGPSGWLETFNRKQADEALQTLLGTVPVGLAVEGFVRSHGLSKDGVTWSAIVDHLVSLCRVAETAIDPKVGVAFWAGVNTAIANAKKPKLN